MNEILDSGNRTEFDSGAVRDIQDDKGRCDLLPLDVVAESFPIPERIGHSCLVYLEGYKSTKNDLYLSFAIESYIKEAYSADQVEAYLDVSIHYRDGALKYGENNWQKGLPEWSYISSAVRHYMKFRRGDKDENHRRAVLWNLLCLSWTVENITKPARKPTFGRCDEDWSESK